MDWSDVARMVFSGVMGGNEGGTGEGGGRLLTFCERLSVASGEGQSVEQTGPNGLADLPEI